MDRTMRANIAGIAGAVAMVGVSLASRKLGFAQGDMIYKEGVESALESADVESRVSETQEQALGLGAQMAFSMSNAMTYSRIRHHVGLPGPIAGALFGVGMWGINTVGIAPMLGIRNAPWDQDEANAITTLLSYLAFGAVLGAIFDQLDDDEGNG